MKEWVRHAIMYHIYPLGFCGCEPLHQEMITHRIQKITQWIPYLRQLHINALYLGPVFESYEHGYDTSDYQQLDHRLGSNEDFIQVCDALHNTGIRVILDGVFHHVGRCFWAFQDVLEKREASAYCDWFQDLNFHSDNPFHDGFSYATWEGHHNLIKLNLHHEAVVQYLLESVGMWMDTFHIDGLRLDAADCVESQFFKRLKQFCEARNPDFWLMGEIIHGDYNRWANPDMLDSVTNYECYKGLYSAHNEKNYFEIGHSLKRQFAKGGIYEKLCLYNFVDNHDVNRIASTIKDQRDLYNIYTMLYTMPGIPSLYYGSEAGIHGIKQHGSDQQLRPCLELKDVEAAQPALLAHLQKLGMWKGELQALADGDYEQIMLSNEQFIFHRRQGEHSLYAAFNTAEKAVAVSFSATVNTLRNLWDDTLWQRQANGSFTVSIPAKSSLLLVPAKAQKSAKALAEAKPTKRVEETKEHVKPAAAPIPETLPLGRYEHFKGQHYALLYVAMHSETLEPYVVYRQLYGDGKVWVRPLAMFMETVEVQGQRVPRFRYLGK